jgi:nitroreductase
MMAELPTETILRFLNSHGSVRRFTDQPVSEEQITRIVEIAQRAPTSSNLQAYSIIVLRDPEKKERLSLLSGDQPHVRECPVLLAFCPDLLRLRKICIQSGYRLREEYFEYLLVAIVDAALAGQNALLAAEAQGLGGCMIGGLRNRPQEVAELLDLPPRVFVLFGLALGVPQKPAKVKPRLPASVIRHDEWYETDHLDEGLAAYDRTMKKTGVYRGRRIALEEVGPDLTEKFADENYGWIEHTARRLANPASARPDLRPFLASKKFGFL